MKLTKPQRAVLFAMFDGHCAYCGDALKPNWQGDHFEPLNRQYIWQKSPQTGVFGRREGGCKNPHNDRLENLVPSCRPCNIDKSSFPLEAWRADLEKRVDVCRRNHSAFRHAERFGLVKQTATKVIFYFEKFNLARTESRPK